MSIKPEEIVALNSDLGQPREVDIDAPTIVQIPTLIGAEFSSLPDYVTILPEKICDALSKLADQYDTTFSNHLMPGHIETPTDYQHTQLPDGKYSSMLYQVDMAGLPQDFLDLAERGDVEYDDLVEVLRYRIFEFEDSAAMYNLMRGIHSGLDQDGIPTELSPFAYEFDTVLADTKKSSGLSAFVVGAVSKEKYSALLATELGLDLSDPRIYDGSYIKAISGFDGYVGPDDIARPQDGTLIYARTSAPPAAQKNPRNFDPSQVTVLSDPEDRQVIRAASTTLNVDNPHEGVNINDTKGALPIFSPYSIAVTACNFALLNSEQIAEQFGIEVEDRVRTKPTEAYGAYRQDSRTLSSTLQNGSRLHNQVQKFGSYIMQPEIPGSTIHTPQGEFGYIDRVFLAKDREGKFRVIGGFRNLLPTNNDQARKNTYHGNGGAVWAPILPKIPRSQY